MPRPISNTAPQTLAEWNELCENTHFNAIEAYDNAVAEAKANAEAQWDAEAPTKREELIAQLEANLNAQLTADPATGDFVSLPKDEWDTKYEAGVAEINAELARQKQEAIDHSIMGIQQPDTLEQIQAMYSFMKPQEQTWPESAEEAAVNTCDAVWQVGDQYWDIAEACYVSPKARSSKPVIVLGGEPTVQNLRETIEFYGKTDPRIQLGPEIMTQDELFDRLREERDKRLAETDYLLNADYPIDDTTKAKVMAYRQELRDLPAQIGSPWDGGGSLTPWPVKTW